MIQELIEATDKLPHSPQTAEESLVPILGKFKEMINLWTNSPTLQVILPDQKVEFLTHVQRLVKEAKGVSSGKLEPRPLFIVIFLFQLLFFFFSIAFFFLKKKKKKKNFEFFFFFI